jgi:hypothetical protein
MKARSSLRNPLLVIIGFLLLIVVSGVVLSWADLMRYLRIRQM